MNPPPRRVATPSLSSLKRNETSDHFKPSVSSLKRKETTEHFKPSPVLTKSLKPPPPRNGSARTTRPYFNPAQSTQTVTKPNNIILAGYMAHEFLTKGTIFGETIDPVVASESAKNPSRTAEERYVEVCRLLKTDGSHIAGIVNPTQLARYLNR